MSSTIEATRDNKLVSYGVCELAPRYDARKSFYGKARVEKFRSPTGVLIYHLYSYDTLVAVVEDYKDGRALTLYPDWDCSQTTLRHVKDFAAQYVKSDMRSWTLKKYRKQGVKNGDYLTIEE